MLHQLQSLKKHCSDYMKITERLHVHCEGNGEIVRITMRLQVITKDEQDSRRPAGDYKEHICSISLGSHRRR